MGEWFVGIIHLLSEGSIVFLHGLRGHPYKTWASIHQTGGDGGIGPSNRRQRIKSFFGPPTPSSRGNDKQKTALSGQEQVFWPRDFLAEDIAEARVWTYGYNADIISGLFQANNKNSVSGHGRDLKVRLERDIDNEVDSYIFYRTKK